MVPSVLKQYNRSMGYYENFDVEEKHFLVCFGSIHSLFSKMHILQNFYWGGHVSCLFSVLTQKPRFSQITNRSQTQFVVVRISGWVFMGLLEGIVLCRDDDDQAQLACIWELGQEGFLWNVKAILAISSLFLQHLNRSSAIQSTGFLNFFSMAEKNCLSTILCMYWMLIISRMNDKI